VGGAARLPRVRTHNGHDTGTNNGVQEVEVKYHVHDFAGLLVCWWRAG
jgi:hypothetical protein